MNWTEVKIYTTTAGIDPLTGSMLDLGLQGFMIEDAQDFDEFLHDTTPHWDYVDQAVMEKMKDCETCVTIYVADNPQGMEELMQVRQILARLKAQDPDGKYGRLELEMKDVDEEDWSNAWKKYYHPVQVGEHLVVCPSWEAYDRQPDDVVLTLNPGMAFGTGTHETTSLCLETLDSMVKGGERVLDIGTGSGILAIAALKLGAAEAEGVDIDPMCVRTAGENAERNGVAEHFTVLVGDLSDKASGKYNIITANIVAAAILSLAPHVPVLMAPGARFIASGIIDTRKDEVLAGLRAAGLEPVEIKEKRGWVCVICKNAAEV